MDKKGLNEVIITDVVSLHQGAKTKVRAESRIILGVSLCLSWNCIA